MKNRGLEMSKRYKRESTKKGLRWYKKGDYSTEVDRPSWLICFVTGQLEMLV